MFKKLLSIALCAIMIMGMGTTAFASNEANSSLLDESCTIALNTPAVFGYQSQWEIVQETTLYGANEEIVAYCIDMQSQESIGEATKTSYAIINSNTSDFPVLLFGIDGVSAYYGKSFDKAYYFGTLDFYISNDGETLNNANTQELLSDEDFSMFANMPTSYNTEDYTDVRAAYLSGANTYSEPEKGDISDAGVSGYSLQWRKGCAPTSVAMMIKSKYSTLTGTTLIDDLATNMGTNSSGASDFPKIVSGTTKYFSDNTNLTAPKTCKWNSKNILGSPNTGLSNNSKADYKSSITAGFPVGVYCASSNITTGGYPNGIGAHMMCGVGYNFSSSGDFVICYTTNTADGKVSFPLTSSGLKNHAWFMLKW